MKKPIDKTDKDWFLTYIYSYLYKQNDDKWGLTGNFPDVSKTPAHSTRAKNKNLDSELV